MFLSFVIEIIWMGVYFKMFIENVCIFPYVTSCNMKNLIKNI
jgi:hypothetical protein